MGIRCSAASPARGLKTAVMDGRIRRVPFHPGDVAAEAEGHALAYLPEIASKAGQLRDNNRCASGNPVAKNASLRLAKGPRNLRQEIKFGANRHKKCNPVIAKHTTKMPTPTIIRSRLSFCFLATSV